MMGLGRIQLTALVLSLLASALGASACSPGSLFGKNNQDAGILEAKTPRRVMPSCSGMDLRSATLDAPTFRSLIKCFNSQGALEKVSRLSARLTDAQLGALLSVANEHLLTNRARLFQVEASWAAMEKRHLLEPAFRAANQLLTQDQLLTSVVALLKSGYYAQPGGHGAADPLLLRALERLGRRFDPGNVARGLDAGLTVAGSRAFGSLAERLRSGSRAGRGLRELTDGVSAYVRERDPRGATGQQLLETLARGELLPALDPVVGRTSSELRAGVPRATSLLYATLADDGKLMGDLSSLFHAENGPIRCMNGSKVVPNGVTQSLRELTQTPGVDPVEYFGRSNVLKLANVTPFCEFSPELSRYYPALVRLSETTAIGPTTDLVRAFYGVTRAGQLSRDGEPARPLLGLFIDFIGDSALKHLIPTMVELNDRGAWEDLFLLAALPRVEDRAAIASFAAYLSAPAPELGGQSVQQVLASAIGRMAPADLYALASGIGRINASDTALLLPTLETLRSVFYANDAHPIVGMGAEVLAGASANDAFFRALFDAAATEEFRPALRELAEMSADGRLRSLTGDLIQLMHKFAQAGATPVHALAVPSFTPARRHDLSAADLDSFAVRALPRQVPSACAQVDLGISLDSFDHPRYGGQIAAVVGCLNEGGRYDDAARAVEFLRHSRAGDGRDYLQVVAGFVRDLRPTREAAGFLTDSLFRAVDDRRAWRLLDALPLWTTRAFPDARGESGPVLRPLFDLARPIAAPAILAAWKRLESFGATVLRGENAPSILKYARYLWGREIAPTPAADRGVGDPDGVFKAIGTLECRQSGLRERFDAIVDDYEYSVNNWELRNGVPRRGWEFAEFDAEVEPILKTFAEPDSRDTAAGGRRVYDAFLAVARYFSLAPGQRPVVGRHYAPADLVRWLQDRASDERVITYFYPGEAAPRTRLVNTLDRLELILINADYVAPWPISRNFGLQFVGELAEAWGDEPEALWPPEIRAAYAGRGQRPPTLAQVVGHIESTLGQFESLLGYPELPPCLAANARSAKLPAWALNLAIKDLHAMKAAMYNSRQVVSVLRENVPGSGTATQGGLRVLRDLFFEVKYSSAPTARGPKDGWNNHLSLVLKKVRMGFLRQLGRQVRKFPVGDAALVDVFAGVIRLADSAQADTAMRALIVDDPGHGLVRKVMGRIFAAIDREPELPFLRQLSFYLLANLGDASIPRFQDELLRTVGAVADRHRAFLTDHVDAIDEILTSPRAAGLARALYEDHHPRFKAMLAELLRDALSDPARGVDAVTLVSAVQSDANAKAAWQSFVDRKQALESSPEYRRLELASALRPVWELLEDRSNSAAGRVAQRLRVYLAERLERGDLDSLLLLSARDPQGFYQVLATVGHYSENGDLKEFIEMIRRSLSDPQR